MQNTWWLMNFQGTVVILRSKFNMPSIWRFSFFFPATTPLPLQEVSLAPCPLFIFVGVLAWQFFYMYLFRASVRSMSYPPVDFWPLHMSAASRAGLVSGWWNLPWDHLRNFSLVFWDETKPKILGRSFGTKFAGTQSKHDETQKF